MNFILLLFLLGTESLLGLKVTKQFTTESALHHLSSEYLVDHEVNMKYTPNHHGYCYTLSNCQYNRFIDKIVRECKRFIHL